VLDNLPPNGVARKHLQITHNKEMPKQNKTNKQKTKTKTKQKRREKKNRKKKRIE